MGENCLSKKKIFYINLLYYEAIGMTKELSIFVFQDTNTVKICWSSKRYLVL